MKLGSIYETSNQLAFKVSTTFLLIHLKKIAFLSFVWCLILLVALLNKPHTSLLGVIKAQIYLLPFWLLVPVLLLGLLKQLNLWTKGETYVFDREHNNIKRNAVSLALLSSLHHIEIRNPYRNTKINSYYKKMSLRSWPSLWLVFDNNRAVKLIDTLSIKPSEQVGSNQMGLEQTIYGEAVDLANQIASYVGVQVVELA